MKGSNRELMLKRKSVWLKNRKKRKAQQFQRDVRKLENKEINKQQRIKQHRMVLIQSMLRGEL